MKPRIVLCVALCLMPVISFSATAVFQRPLSLGMRGEDVRALQIILNKDMGTLVAESGVGSPGNETDYFGLATKRALIKFQEKYANEILAPTGVTHGNGYAGGYTRAKLRKLSDLIAKIEGTDHVAVSAVAMSRDELPHTPSIDIATTTVPAHNPNLENIDVFFATLDRVAAKQGISADALVKMKTNIMNVVATTTDLRAVFLKQIQEGSRKTAVDNSLAGKILSTFEGVFDKVFRPERAVAAVGVPFGGALLFAVPCIDGFWNITLEPLPPSYPVLLAYVAPSQAFPYYNIPVTRWLLGYYEPVPAPYCWIGEIPYPSEGLITPMVGSSLMPV